jgi:uncharacterized protein YceK
MLKYCDNKNYINILLLSGCSTVITKHENTAPPFAEVSYAHTSAVNWRTKWKSGKSWCGLKKLKTTALKHLFSLKEGNHNHI